MNYPFWDIPHSRLGLGDRHDRHLPRHDLAVCRGRRILSAPGRAQSPAHDQTPTLRAAWLKQLASHSKFFLILTASSAPFPAWASGSPSASRTLKPPARSSITSSLAGPWSGSSSWSSSPRSPSTTTRGTGSTRSFTSKLAGSMRAHPLSRSSSSTAFSLSCSRRAIPGSGLPGQATKPANSGMRSSIRPIGRACCCAPAFALRWRVSGR